MITTFKTFKTHLDERRRSEKIGGKSREILAGHQAALDYFQGKDLTQYGVTMNDIPKVGVNPKSHYDTPLGVYFYPADYYVGTISAGLELPFQHKARYINILKIKTTKILYLDQINKIDVMDMLAKLKKIYPERTIAIDSLDQESNYNAKMKTPAGKFWYVLYKISEAKYLKTSSITTNKPSIVWNILLRKLGYDCVIDPGLGIIHDNEKNSGFFTNASSEVVTNVKRFDNNLETNAFYYLIKTLKNPSISDAVKINYIDSHFDKFKLKFNYPLRSLSYNHYNSEKPNVAYIGKKDINRFSDDLKIKFFSNLAHYHLIRFIKDLENPSDYVLKSILEKTKKLIGMIRYMKNPSKEVQMMAVKNNLSVMKYIENPAPEVVKYYEANK